MTKTEKAMKNLKEAMQNDPDYAHTWHCNIAMMCYDGMRAGDRDVGHEVAHKGCNEGASRFMKMCFNVETSAL